MTCRSLYTILKLQKERGQKEHGQKQVFFTERAWSKTGYGGESGYDGQAGYGRGRRRGLASKEGHVM